MAPGGKEPGDPALDRPDRVDALIDDLSPVVAEILGRLDGDEFTTIEFIEVILTDPAAAAPLAAPAHDPRRKDIPMNAPLREISEASRPAGIGADEWALRIELAACYRLFDHLGWTELIYNHITMRVPGDEAHFLINPYGLHYAEVTASNLVKIDVHGHVVGELQRAVDVVGEHRLPLGREVQAEARHVALHERDGGRAGAGVGGAHTRG